MRKTAFTLAEVLITLVIIGVIAALTIPTLMNNMKDEANIVALKKFYSETNQLLQTLATQDCGTTGTIEGCFSSKASMEQAIVKHFKVSKDCRLNADKNCWTTFNYNIDGTGGTYDPDDDVSSYYTLTTLDGMSVQIRAQYPDCSEQIQSAPQDSPVYKTCGYIRVDTNGFKAPNRFGKDVFEFAITSNKAPLLYPVGGKDAFYWNTGAKSCQTSYPDGSRCTGRFMENGWKADYSDAP